MRRERETKLTRWYVVGMVVDAVAYLLGALWRGYVRLMDEPLRRTGWWPHSLRLGVGSIVREWGGILLDYGGSGAYNVTHPAFGAVMDGTTDSTVALSDALAYVETNGGFVLIPAGTLLLTDETEITFHRANIKGAGVNQTYLKFAPTTDGLACLSFIPGAGPLFQCTLKDLAIFSTDTTHEKTAIRLTDTSEFLLHNVAVGGGVDWEGGTGGSKGLHTLGRDQLSVRNVDIEADRPLLISPNPLSGIDCDHYRISESIFIANDDTYPCWEFEDDVYISNFSASDISLNRGLHGVSIGDAAATSSSVLSFTRLRWEQGSSGTGSYIIKVDTTGLHNLRLTQVSGGSGTNHDGYYLRGVDGVVFDQCDYTGTGEALNVNTTVLGMEHRNFFCLDGSTFSLGGLQESFAIFDGKEGSTEPGYRIAWFIDPTVSGLGLHVRLFGTRLQAMGGTLTSGANVSIPVGPSQVAAAILHLDAAGATKHEGGTWGYAASVSSGKMKKIAGTTDTADTNVGSKLCLIDGGSLPSIVNNLGETVSYVVHVIWKV